MYKTKRGSSKAAPQDQDLIKLDNVHVHTGDGTVEVSANHLLAITSHDALARSEILGCEDSRGDDEGYVRSVDVTSLEVGTSLVTNKDLVAGEVGVLVDCETVAQATDCSSTEGELAASLALTIDAEGGLVEDRSLEDGSNFG